MGGLPIGARRVRSSAIKKLGARLQIVARLAPKSFERRSAQFGITRRVLYRPMAKPILTAPNVMACICKGVAAPMPQHVGMYWEREPGPHADAL